MYKRFSPFIMNALKPGNSHCPISSLGSGQRSRNHRNPINCNYSSKSKAMEKPYVPLFPLKALS